jgi:hypothetical protein
MSRIQEDSILYSLLLEELTALQKCFSTGLFCVQGQRIIRADEQLSSA